jgi:multidrug efflux system outer membrane protein
MAWAAGTDQASATAAVRAFTTPCCPHNAGQAAHRAAMKPHPPPRPDPWRRLLLGGAGAFAMVLAGCAPTPELQRPVPPIPGAWPGQFGAQPPAQAHQLHWRQYFADPQLQALIVAALAYNRDLRLASARVLEARAQFGLARAETSPLINLLGSSSTTHAPSSVRGAGDDPTEHRLDVSVSAISWEIDFWGRLSSLTEAARANYLSSEEAQRTVQLSLVADVAGAFYTLLQTREQLHYARETVQLREQSVGLLGKGRALGVSDDYVFQQARGALEQASLLETALEQQLAIATNRLKYLVGYAPVELPQGRGLEGQGLDTPLSPGLPSEVLVLRPDVMAAEQRLRSAHASIDAARKAFLPKILLTAGLGLASQGLAGLFRSGAWSFTPSITLPLFDGGRLDASVDLAQAREVVAVADYEKTIQQAFREVSDLLSARSALALQLRASQANLQAQQSRLQIAQLRHDVGAVSYLEVLDAQRETVAAQQTTAQLRRAQLDAAAQLYKALGGGTQAPAAAGAPALAAASAPHQRTVAALPPSSRP